MISSMKKYKENQYLSRKQGSLIPDFPGKAVMILVKGILLLPISMFIRIMSSMKMILDWLLLQQMRVSTPYLMVMCCSLFHLRLPMKLALDLFTWVSRINSISIASASVYQYPIKTGFIPHIQPTLYPPLNSGNSFIRWHKVVLASTFKRMIL